MNLSKIISRIRAALSFRLKRRFRLAIAWIYKRRLTSQGQTNIPTYKPLSDLRLMFYTGRAQLEMLEQSVRSVEHGWSTIPVLLLVSDGSISTDKLRQSFTWWSNELVVMTWQEFAERAAKRGRSSLAKLAEHNMLGRKLCAILESALQGDVLFSDTDVLWFKELPSRPPTLQNEVKIKLSEDIQEMYDDRLLAEMDCKELSQTPWLNTGVCFVHGDVFAEAGLDLIVKSAAQNPHYFSEQTILSWASKRLGGESWPRSAIYLGIEDEVRWPKPSYRGQSWIARHYPGNVRHWFWVDAYFLSVARMGNTVTR